MKKFDLEKAKAGEPINTGDNKEVRIVCFDRLHSVFPIIALIKDGNSEIMQCYTKDGYIYPNDNISTNNLFLKEKRKMELEEFLKGFKRYVMIGSEALGVNTDDSDIDIACLYDDLPEYLKEVDKLDASLYFNILPIGNIMLIRHTEPNVDIIIYENIEQLNIIRQCIDDLKLVPKCILKNKQLRCLLFEELMLHYGFERVCLKDDICI